MTGADSNVLLRYLVSDDIQQQKKVERFLASTRVAGEIVYVSCIVLCEMVWVLRRLYDLSVPDVLDKIERLLNADIFRVEDEDIFEGAVHPGSGPCPGQFGLVVRQLPHHLQALPSLGDWRPLG